MDLCGIGFVELTIIAQPNEPVEFEEYSHDCGLEKGHEEPHKCHCGEEW